MVSPFQSGNGRLAQLVRALVSHTRGPEFESRSVHQPSLPLAGGYGWHGQQEQATKWRTKAARRSPAGRRWAEHIRKDYDCINPPITLRFDGAQREATAGRAREKE